MTTLYLGIDVSKGYADFCFRLASSPTPLWTGRWDDTPQGHRALAQQLQHFRQDLPGPVGLQAGLEATGGLERNWLAALQRCPGPRTLYQLNPLTLHHFLQRHLHHNATDPGSARGITHYLQEGLGPSDRPYEPLDEGLRTLYRHTRRRLGQAAELQNELQSLLPVTQPYLVPFCRQGCPQWVLHLLVRYPTAQALSRARRASLEAIPYLSASRAAWLKEQAKVSIAACQDPLTGQVLQALARELQSQRQSTQALQAQLVEALASQPDFQRLVSIPGVGAWTAVCLLLEAGDLRRFSSPEALVAYAGLDPRVHQSGDGRRRGGISRRGRRELRALLYPAALAAVRHNPPVRAFYQRLRQAGKPGLLALVACMAKLLRLAYACVTREQAFDPARAARPRRAAPSRSGSGADRALPPSPASGSLEAPVTRREAQRRRGAATEPQVGGIPPARGLGAAPSSQDSALPPGCQVTAEPSGPPRSSPRPARALGTLDPWAPLTGPS